MASEPTNQDLIDAMATLQEAVESLKGSVDTLNDSTGDVFRLFDPQGGEAFGLLLSLLTALRDRKEPE